MFLNIHRVILPNFVVAKRDKIKVSMTTNLRENSFIITITSLTTVTFIALIATLIMALLSSEDACVTPMMIIDLILVLIIFFVYFCKNSEATETTKLTENVPVLSPPSYNDICKESKRIRNYSKNLNRS